LNPCTYPRPSASAKSLPNAGTNSFQQTIRFRQVDATPGALNDDSMVRGIITDAIKRCGKSREQIADEMSDALALPVTARMIASFTAESKELHRWPGAWDRAFCQVTGDERLMVFRIERSGLHVINDSEKDLLELGRQFLIRNQADEQIALLQKRLHGVAL